MRHAKRGKYALVDIIVEGHAADSFDNMAGKRGGIIGIGGRGARGEDPFRQGLPGIFAELHDRFRIIADQMANRFLESGAVGHDVAQRNRLAVIRRNLEVEISIHILVEVEFSGFDLLHHCRPGEQFGNRTGAEHRGFAIDRLFGGEVGIAIAFFNDGLPVVHHDHRTTGNLSALQGIRHEAVQPCRHICGVENDCFRRRCRRLAGLGIGSAAAVGVDRGLGRQRDKARHRQYYHEFIKKTHISTPCAHGLVHLAATHAALRAVIEL